MAGQTRLAIVLWLLVFFINGASSCFLWRDSSIDRQAAAGNSFLIESLHLAVAWVSYIVALPEVRERLSLCPSINASFAHGHEADPIEQ